MRKIDLSNFQVATSETARDINCRILLNLVRKHQPISRADLTRCSGLQRSTVSVLTEKLLAEQWLKEGALGQLPRGRRPTYLHLNGDRGGIIGINIQPLVTDMALANLDGRFLAQESLPTPATPADFVKEVAQRVRGWMKSYPDLAYEGIGVSLPGRVDLKSQRFVFAPNLMWHLEDLKPRLEQATGLPVDMENAANACALSEFWFGTHAEGVVNLVAVTVSEGIGVGLILNGQLVRGSSGLAGEFGHIALNENGPKCRCGNQGCWEVYASNSAALRHYNEVMLPARGGKAESGASRSLAEFDDLLSVAEHGDKEAVATLERMGHYLGRGIAMLVTGLAPEVIVVVGEVTQAWDRVLPIITEVVKQHCLTHSTTRIIASDPARLPRLRGIVALVLQKHFGAPAIA